MIISGNCVVNWLNWIVHIRGFLSCEFLKNQKVEEVIDNIMTMLSFTVGKE